MTSIRFARRFPAVLAIAVLVSLLAANILPPLADARTSHVTQDDDPAWSGEGRPHDWDSPGSSTQINPGKDTNTPIDAGARTPSDEQTTLLAAVHRWIKSALSIHVLTLGLWSHPLFSLRG